MRETRGQRSEVRSKQRGKMLRAGFTATEIMIVIGIMVLLLAMAVPAFNFITGSRSVDGAENLASAMMARARSYAIANHRPAGVAFFVDLGTGKTAMALVQGKASNVGYSAWTFESYQQDKSRPSDPPNQPPPPGPLNSPTTPYYQTDQVDAMIADGYTVPAAYPAQGFPAPADEGKLIVKTFGARRDHVSMSGPPPAGTHPPDTPAASNDWGPIDGNSDLELVPDTDFQFLPAGVACQLINDPKHPPIPPNPPNRNIDRYVRTGVIMFDSEGRLATQLLTFRAVSNLGATIGLTVDQPAEVTPGTPTPFFTQLGIALYDREAFANQPNHTEADYVMPNMAALGAAPASVAQEQAEEAWIDQNALPLFVNRYNGNLLKGE